MAVAGSLHGFGIGRQAAAGATMRAAPVDVSRTASSREEAMCRTRISGHAVEPCGAPVGGAGACNANAERAEVAVLRDQPRRALAGGEVVDGIADLVDGLEDATMAQWSDPNAWYPSLG